MAAAAPIAISGATKLVSLLGGALLAAHTQRLKDAQNENAALVNLVPAYDADIKNIVSAYNSGQATAAQCIVALQQVDQQCLSYLKAQVGKPGTAWSESTGLAGKCDKTCTAGCCIYYGDLGPPLSLLQIALGGSAGKWGASDPRFSDQPGGYVITVPQVFASKYGGTNRPSYTLTVLKKAMSASNPPQFAQTDSPSGIPVGRITNGTPNGQTPTFSATSQGLLANANALASMQYPASQGAGFTTVAQASAGSSSNKTLLIAGGVIAILAALAFAFSKE